MDRTSPMDKHMEVMINRYGLAAAPAAPQMFGNAGKEHMEKYGAFLFLQLQLLKPKATRSFGATMFVFALPLFVFRHKTGTLCQNRMEKPQTFHQQSVSSRWLSRCLVTSKYPEMYLLSKRVTICAGTRSSRMSTVWSR